MPGSPKKRAKREAAERQKELAAMAPPTEPAPAVTPLQGEVLSPIAEAPEPTRTALKRAMRARAQEHAAEAIAVLVANMRNEKLSPDKRGDAANKILEWGLGKPTQEIEAGDGAQMIVIRRFGEET